MEGGAAVEGLALAGAERDAHLDTPDLADLGGTVALGTLGGGQDNLLGALNLVAVKEPRGGALDEVALVGVADLFEQGGDLALGRGLLGGGLGLFLIGALGEQAGGDHQAEEELVGVVVGEEEVGGTAGDGVALLAGEDGVAGNGAESVNLGAELDLDGLAILDLGGGLGLIRGQGSVGSDIGRGGDGGGVGEAWVNVSESVLIRVRIENLDMYTYPW